MGRNFFVVRIVKYKKQIKNFYTKTQQKEVSTRRWSSSKKEVFHNRNRYRTLELKRRRKNTEICDTVNI